MPKVSKSAIYDSIVVGAGPAGLSAAVFMARAQLKVLVIGEHEKSQMALAVELGNYLGTDGWSGPKWLQETTKQVRKYGAETKIPGEVVGVRKEKDGTFVVKTSDRQAYKSKTLVLATGMSYMAMYVEREKELTGKGVHYCVFCDGWFYKGKKVLVVGNTNYAAEEALELLAYTKDVAIYTHGKEPLFSREYAAELKKRKIPVFKSVVEKLEGKQRLEGVVLEGNKRLKVDGVFVAIGTASALSFAQQLALDVKNNQLVVNRETGETAVKNVFAAGSAIGPPIQIAKSVGDGCVAAVSIIQRLKGLGSYTDHT